MEAMRYVKSMIDLQKGGQMDFGTYIQLSFDQMTAIFRTKILEVINAGDVAEAEEGAAAGAGGRSGGPPQQPAQRRRERQQQRRW